MSLKQTTRKKKKIRVDPFNVTSPSALDYFPRRKDRKEIVDNDL
jgi:hypothetical protein